MGALGSVGRFWVSGLGLRVLGLGCVQLVGVLVLGEFLLVSRQQVEL